MMLAAKQPQLLNQFSKTGLDFNKEQYEGRMTEMPVKARPL